MIGGAALALAQVVSIVGTTAPAEAASIPGCHGRWRVQADPWQETIFAAAVSPLGGVILDKIVLRATAIYRYCDSFDGKPNLVKVTKVDYSMSDVDRHLLLVGARFHPFFYEENGRRHLIPKPPYLLKDDGNGYSAGTQRIAPRDRVWLRATEKPMWNLGGEIVYEGFWPDHPFDFYAGKNIDNNLLANSVVLSGWHRSK